MSKPKIGKGIDDIFSKPPKQEPVAKKQAISLEPEPREKMARGRPQEHKEDWTKVTVVLLDSQIHWLDKLALDIRQHTKAAVSRAEIIRALIGAVEQSGLDLTHTGSEQGLKTLVLNKLKTS